MPIAGGPAVSSTSSDEGSFTESSRWLAAAVSLESWMRQRDFAGYDPFDTLNSPLCFQLARRSRWLGVALTQLGKRSPVNVRPFLGVKPERNAKGIGLVLGAYSRLWTATRATVWRERAEEMVSWLEAHQRPGMSGVCWGYNFPWANRSFVAPRGTPSGVVTSFVGHALLDADERLGLRHAGQLAERTAGFLLKDLNRTEQDSAGRFAVSYTPVDQRIVHNANVLAASLLARIARRTGDRSCTQAALAMARFTMAAQRADGSWTYGTARRDGWVDGFHTSYTLLALREVGRSLGTDEFEPSISLGARYWADTFLAREGVSHTSEAHFPIDSHAVAHALISLTVLSDVIGDSHTRADALANWAIREMRSPEGYFYYHRTRRGRNRVPYMRWVQAWMLFALSDLASAGLPRVTGNT